MGNYKYRIAGDKCPSCKRGNLKLIHIPRTTGSVLVSGLCGLFVADDFFNDERNYFECNKCCQTYNRRYWDENAPKDKPLNKTDYFFILCFCVLSLLVIGLGYLFLIGNGYFLGWLLK